MYVGTRVFLNKYCDLIFLAKPSNKIAKLIKITLKKQNFLFFPLKNDKIDSKKNIGGNKDK